MKNKKIISIILFVFLIQVFAQSLVFAENKAPKNEKLIIITANRLDLEDFKSINSIGESNQGYIGLMNIRGAKGTNDASSYASIGWGRKSYVLNKDLTFFDYSDVAKSNHYKFTTKEEPSKISNLNINTLIQTNSESDFGAIPGNLGEIAKKNDLKISVIGNSDKEEPLLFSGAIAMDTFGRINSGNIDDVNIVDYEAPYSIRTDYDKLLISFREQYKSSDIVVIELGDSYRLDEYKKMMTDSAYEEYKGTLINRIDSFISNVENELSKNDSLMVVSPFPSLENYKEGYRLSPVYILNENEEGLGVLTSASTRRDGVISNIDISAYINNRFELINPEISGKPIVEKQYENPWTFLEAENQKIVSLSSVRIPVLYTYAVFEMCVWILTLIIGLFYAKVPKIVIRAVKFILRITLLIPLVILIIPIFNFADVIYSLIIGLLFLTVGYAIISKLIKNDLNKRPVESISGSNSNDEIEVVLNKYGIFSDRVELWGTGTPMREFLWSEDMADACIYVMQNVDFKDLIKDKKEIRNTHINIGTGSDITIKDLSSLIARIIDYKGNISFDSSKPDGTMKKLTDPSKLNGLGWKHQVEIEEGVEIVFEWYKN